MGDSLFLFMLQEEGPPASNETTPGAERVVPGSTTQLRIEDALYLKPDKVLAALTPTARTARDLNALLKISNAVNSIPDPQSLQRKLLELIFEVLPAERGAILLTDGRSYALNKSSRSEQSFHVSCSITDHVIRERIAILGNDIQQSEKFGDSSSLIAARIYSLLCVPLVVFENVLGTLYLDTIDPNTLFDEGDLQLITAIAGIAAVAINNAGQMEWLIEENRRLQTAGNIEHGMIGESPAMRKVYDFIAKAAPTDSTVLLYGESGTGKELAARAIHLNSRRTAKPFVPINCGALAETLLESELFGHEKGAFTGAIAQKKGKLEVADGGTVFLDEVSEMSPALQVKLLRVLQEREFDRVGGTRPIRVDVRLIAATNKNLEEVVKAGTFRNDLYYRLNVVTLMMPPLRDRREDIPLLASYFALKCSKKVQRRIKGISPEARETLMHYDWPGNVRELENAIERAVVLGSTEMILQEDLP
ncbi:MAG TPA: sigma 54-interacting transcriptional regulator, partial [Acidobacteriota bacterium]